MSEADSIKEELGWLKILLAIFAAIDVSLIAWIAQNFATAERLIVMVAVFGVFVSTTALVFINRLAYRRIRELEKV